MERSPVRQTPTVPRTGCGGARSGRETRTRLGGRARALRAPLTPPVRQAGACSPVPGTGGSSAWTTSSPKSWTERTRSAWVSKLLPVICSCYLRETLQEYSCRSSEDCQITDGQTPHSLQCKAGRCQHEGDETSGLPTCGQHQQAGRVTFRRAPQFLR